MKDMNQSMAKVNKALLDAIVRSVRKGVEPREATRRHLAALEAQWPKVYAAFTVWLAAQAN